MAEAEAYDYNVDTAEQAELTEFGEASVAIEGEPAEDPSMAATLFAMQDGKYMGAYTSPEGETQQIELLAHDPALQEKVLSLEIGSEPIINQGFGDVDGTPMMFQMTYERTEAGIVTTPAEFALNIDPETDGLTEDDDGGELITPDWAKKPPLAEEGQKKEGKNKEETKPLDRKTWWEQELGIKSKEGEKPKENKRPEGLLDFLERSANSEEANEPDKNTLTRAISEAMEQPNLEAAVSQQPTEPQNSADSKPDQPSITTLQEPKPQEPKEPRPEPSEPNPGPQDDEPAGGITIAPELEQPDEVTEEINPPESTSEAVVEVSLADIVEVQEASIVAIPEATDAATHEIIILEQPTTKETQSDSEIVQAPQIAVETTTASVLEAPPTTLEIAVPQPAVTRVEAVIQIPDQADEQIAAEKKVEQVAEIPELNQIELPASHNKVKNPGEVAALAEPRLVTEFSLPVEVSKPDLSEVSLSSEASATEAAEDPLPVLIENVAVYLNEVQEQADLEETVAPPVKAQTTNATPVTARPAAINESPKIDSANAVIEPAIFDEAAIKIATSPIKALTQSGVPNSAQITANQAESTQEVTNDGIQITTSLADSEAPRRTTRHNTAHMTIQPVTTSQIQMERPPAATYVPTEPAITEKIVMLDPLQEVPAILTELTNIDEPTTTIVKATAPARADTIQKDFSQIQAPEETGADLDENVSSRRPANLDTAHMTVHTVLVTPPPSIPPSIKSVEQPSSITTEPTIGTKVTVQNQPVSTYELNLTPSHPSLVTEPNSQSLDSTSAHHIAGSQEISITLEENDAVQSWMNNFGSFKPQNSSNEAFTRPSSAATILVADTPGDDTEDDVIIVNFDSDERRHAGRHKGSTRSTTA